jgi:hypothetical protein
MSGFRQNQADREIHGELLEPVLVSGTSVTATVNTKVYLDNAAGVDVTMPATFQRGDRVTVVGIQGGSIAPNTGHTIVDGTTSIDDTETADLDEDTTIIELYAVNTTTWHVGPSRNFATLTAAFVPFEAIIMGGEDTGPTALSSTETQNFTSPFTVAAGGNALTNVRYRHTCSETIVGHSYCNGGFSTGATEVSSILKMTNSDQSNSAIGGTLASVKSHMGRGRHEAGSRGHLVGGKTSATEVNIAERQDWDDTMTSLGAILSQTTGQMGTCYSGLYTYPAGGSRAGTFRTTTITRLDNTAESYATLGIVLSTTSVNQDGMQDLINGNGVIVGGDNTTGQKIDMTFGSEAISQPATISVIKEAPSTGSSLTDGWIHCGGSPASTGIDRWEWAGDVRSTPVSTATARREVDAATA